MKRRKGDPELQAAKSLHKEYMTLLRYANREGAPKIERDYFMGMANRTAQNINWRKLEPGPKEETQQRNWD